MKKDLSNILNLLNLEDKEEIVEEIFKKLLPRKRKIFKKEKKLQF